MNLQDALEKMVSFRTVLYSLTYNKMLLQETRSFVSRNAVEDQENQDRCQRVMWWSLKETSRFAQQAVLETWWVIAGPALASAGPDWKHFCGAPLSDVCRNFWRGVSSHNDTNDMKEGGPNGYYTPVSPLQKRR